MLYEHVKFFDRYKVIHLILINNSAYIVIIKVKKVYIKLNKIRLVDKI